MEQVTVDQVVQETLFEEESSGQCTWKFCYQITLPRSEVLFFSNDCNFDAGSSFYCEIDCA